MVIVTITYRYHDISYTQVPPMETVSERSGV